MIEQTPIHSTPTHGLAKLADIRIVLVSTSHPGNIGSAARAMKNMGLSDLVLVAPKEYPSDKAYAMASSALDVLNQARVVATLQDAVRDCQWVVGTSARRRCFDLIPQSPREVTTQAIAMQAGQRVALVFGRERTGLTNEEVELCHGLVEIPANPEYSSLNLAQAVQVLTYELRLAALSASPEVADDRDYPSANDVENFYQHLEQVLLNTGFLDPTNPRHLMRRLRQLFGRVRLDQRELNILRGIFATVEMPKNRRLPRSERGV